MTDLLLGSTPTAALPNSATNPLEAELNRPWEEQQNAIAQAQAKWRTDAVTSMDSALLDWDNFSKGKPIDLNFAEDPETARKRGLVNTYLTIENNGEEIGGGDLGPQMMRDQIAMDRFNGRGVGDDLAFYGEIEKEAQGRKDTRELLGDLTNQATKATLTGAVGEQAGTFQAWREEAMKKPGYKRGMDADYLEAWQANQERTKELYQRFEEPLAKVWQAMKGGSPGQAASNAYFTTAEEDRQEFMNALGLLARTLPSERQAEFFNNLATQAGRDVEGLGGRAIDALKEFSINSTVIGSGSESLRAQGQMERAERNFRADVRRIQSETFDPIKKTWGDGTMGVIEGGLYAAPGAIASTAMMMIPGVGTGLMYSSMTGSAYEDTRRTLIDGGLSDDDASNYAQEWAPAIAGIQFIPEMIGFKAITRKLPVFEKAMSAMTDRVKNRAVRAGISTLAIGVTETVTENVQDLVPELVQEVVGSLAQDVPEVDWAKQFEGYGDKTLSTFVAVLPLAIFGAAGGLSQEARQAAFAEASPTQMIAAGGTQEAVQRILKAKTQGPAALSAAIDNFQSTLEPLSPEAKAASVELDAQIAEQVATAEAAQRSGVIPTFSRTPEGWSVRDGETGAEIGTADSSTDALRIAMVHSSAIDENNADQTAFLATMLQAGEVTTKGDSKQRQTGFEFSPGKKVTAAQEAAISPKDEARVLQQVAAKGDSAFSGIVLGKSVTEFKQNVRNTVNKINAGGSILTVFHEEAHGHFREALNAGRLTKESTVETIRGLQQSFTGKKTKAGEDIQFIPADGEVSDTQLDEAVSELMEALILKDRKKSRIPTGMVSKNLSALARMNGGAKSFKSFVDTVREFFGVAFSRAYEIRKAIKEGKVKESDIEAFTNKLFGLEAQDEHNAAAIRARDEILGGDPFSLGADRDVDAKYLAAVESGDMESAQRMVDEAAKSAGYNIGPVYHGTNQKFDTFDPKRRAAGTSTYGEGFMFFTDSEELATEYSLMGSVEYRKTLANLGAAEQEYESAVFDVLGVNEDYERNRYHNNSINKAIDAGKITQEEYDRVDKADSEVYRLREILQENRDQPYEPVVQRAFLDLDTDVLGKGYGSGMLAGWDIINTALAEEAVKTDASGFIAENVIDSPFDSEIPATIYAVRDPNQIKSADPVTYDASGNVIPLSQRFNSESDLISYSLGSAKMADALAENALKRIKSPKAKARIFQGIADRMGKLRALIDATGNAYNFDAFGKPYEGEARFSQEKKDILNGLALLDGILAAMPPDLRGRVGGYTQLAKLDTQEKRLAYLKTKLKSVDKVVNGWLKKEYGLMLDKLLARAKPVKGKPGEKPKGKAGATVHDIFAVLGEARGWDQAKTDQHVDGLLSSIARGTLTPEQEAHATLEASLVGLIGNWKDADAARRAAAIDAATKVFEAGYAKFKLATLLKAEGRQIRTKNLQNDTGKTGDAGERDAKMLADNGLMGGWKDNFLSLISFEQLTEYLFGRDSVEANRIVDMERAASALKEDTIQADMDALDDLFANIAGSRLDGETLRWELSQKSIKVDGRQLSPLEAITATLMWRQEDGRRHMLGHKDENGNYSGAWHYNQAFIDKIEAALSPEAQAVRAHIAQEYSAEWAQINPVFVELNGINLPSNPNYSPLTVKPQQAASGQMVDPVTGSTMSGSSTTPGSLRSRGQAIAEPDFRDALQIFIAHRKQIRHWIAYAPLNAEVGVILRNRELGNAIEAKGGDQALKVMRGWMDFFTAGGARDASAHLALNQMMNRISGRVASSVLVGRMGVIAIQATQLGAALAEMPVGSFALRFGKLFTGQLEWGAAFRSEYIQRRLKQMPVVVQQAMEGLKSSKPNRLKYHVQQLGRAIAGMDALMTAGTFAIVHDYQLKQARSMGLSGAEADAYAMNTAERVVDRIAQPTRAGTRSYFENTSAGGPAMRVLWSFASESRQKLMLSLWRLGSADRSLGEKARAVAVTWVVGGMVATIIRAAMRDVRDDDDDEWFDEKNWGVKRLALSSLTGPFQGLPFIGDLIEGGVYSMAGEYLPEGNLFSSIPKSLKAATRVSEWGEKKPDEIIRDIETILSGAALVDPTGNSAAAASLSHLARDLFSIGQNIAE